MQLDNNSIEGKKDKSKTYYPVIITLILLGLLVMILVLLFVVMNFSKIQGWLSGRAEEALYKVVVATLEDPDKDNDGISNIDEINIYGTDPENSDSNNNGISDGEEIYDIFKKNVLNKDSEELSLYRKNIAEKRVVPLEEIFENYGILTYNFYIGIPNEVKEKVKESLALRGEKKFQESINVLEETLKANTNYKWIINYHIGLSYHGMENFKKALEYYEGLLENKDAINPLLYQDIAASFYGLGDESKYVEYLQKSTEEFPENLLAYSKLLQYYVDQNNNLTTAKEIIDKGLKIEPRYSVFYNYLGIIADREGDKNKAFEYYNKITEIDFHNAIAHMNLSIMHREDFNNPKQSLVEALIADEFYPDYSHIKNVLGLAYDVNGDRDQAIIEYKNGINLDPAYDKLYNNLGISYAKGKEYSLAEKNFKKAVDINSKYSNAYNNLGYLYIEQGKYSESISFLEKASSLNPKWFLPHQNLGFAHLNTGKTNDAIREWEIAISLGMKNKEVLQILENIKR